MQETVTNKFCALNDTSNAVIVVYIFTKTISRLTMQLCSAVKWIYQVTSGNCQIRGGKSNCVGKSFDTYSYALLQNLFCQITSQRLRVWVFLYIHVYLCGQEALKRQLQRLASIMHAIRWPWASRFPLYRLQSHKYKTLAEVWRRRLDRLNGKRIISKCFTFCW